MLPDTHVSSCSTLSQLKPDESWHCRPGICPSHQGRKNHWWDNQYIQELCWLAVPRPDQLKQPQIKTLQFADLNRNYNFFLTRQCIFINITFLSGRAIKRCLIEWQCVSLGWIDPILFSLSFSVTNSHLSLGAKMIWKWLDENPKLQNTAIYTQKTPVNVLLTEKSPENGWFFSVIVFLRCTVDL